jgi:predicted alpha/beta superfamily hydrolase
MKHSLLFLLIFNFQFIFAQKAESLSKLLPPIIETLHSETVGQDYILFITLPLNYSPESRNYPVYYKLDAWIGAEATHSSALAKMWGQQIVPVIMVGISFKTNLKEFVYTRTRDFTPPLNPTDSFNRADKFLNFIKTELIPHIENKYAADPNDRGLIGSSSGGIFTTWVLKEEPLLFHKLAIGNPSHSDQDEFLLKDLKLLENIKNADNLEIFIACGSLEDEEVISFSNTLFELVNNNKNIRSEKVIFGNLNHGSAGSYIQSGALNYFYEDKFAAFLKNGWKLYRKKKYHDAIDQYLKAFDLDSERIKSQNRYSLARFYALSNEKENALHQLEIISKDYKSYDHIINNKDLTSLHSDKRWNPIISKIKANFEKARKN